MHNLTHSCISSSEWNIHPRMSFFSSPKMWKSQGERSGLYRGCWSVSQPNLWSLSLNQIGSMGTGVVMQKDDSVWQHSRAFWLYGGSQFLQCVCIALHTNSGSTLYEVDKQRAPAVEEDGHHNFTGTRIGSFGFLWRGRIKVFPLLALLFTIMLKMVAPHFIPCDDLWQKCILFLMVPLQMTQTCRHSVNRLSLCQLKRNPLRTNFLELQVIFDNGMHGAMANANLNTNIFLCDLSVFLDQTINLHSHIRCNGSMGLSQARIVLQRCASFMESLLPLMHTCQGHIVFTIHSRHAMMNFICSSTICLHFQCWQTHFTLHSPPQ